MKDIPCLGYEITEMIKSTFGEATFGLNLPDAFI